MKLLYNVGNSLLGRRFNLVPMLRLVNIQLLFTFPFQSPWHRISIGQIFPTVKRRLRKERWLPMDLNVRRKVLGILQTARQTGATSFVLFKSQTTLLGEKRRQRRRLGVGRRDRAATRQGNFQIVLLSTIGAWAGRGRRQNTRHVGRFFGGTWSSTAQNKVAGDSFPESNVLKQEERC